MQSSASRSSIVTDGSNDSFINGSDDHDDNIGGFKDSSDGFNDSNGSFTDDISIDDDDTGIFNNISDDAICNLTGSNVKTAKKWLSKSHGIYAEEERSRPPVDASVGSRSRPSTSASVGTVMQSPVRSRPSADASVGVTGELQQANDCSINHINGGPFGDFTCSNDSIDLLKKQFDDTNDTCLTGSDERMDPTTLKMVSGERSFAPTDEATWPKHPLPCQIPWPTLWS